MDTNTTNDTDLKPEQTDVAKPKTKPEKKSTRRVPFSEPLSKGKKSTSTPKTYRTAKGTEYDCDNFISDIFEKIKASAYKKEKLEVLHRYKDFPAVKTILIAGFDNSLVPAVDCNVVKLNNQKTARNDGHLYLKDEHVNLYMFYKGGLDSVDSIQKLPMLVKWMNSMHPSESKLLHYTFLQELDSYYRISFSFVKEIFPDIVWGNRGPVERSIHEDNDPDRWRTVEEINKQIETKAASLGTYLGL